jgi:hypothetical protein
MSKPHDYAFYATLLDSYDWYLKSTDDNEFSNFIDRLNRAPVEKTFQQERGLFFNDWVDGKVNPTPEQIKYYKFQKAGHVVDYFKNLLKDCPTQVYTETYLDTKYGVVKLYGFMDATKQDTIYDIKTTAKYDNPRYYTKYQHLVYLSCMAKDGMDRFIYAITDFNDVFEEKITYSYDGDNKLKYHVQDFIVFLEKNKDLITDKKLFGGK